MSGVDFSVTLFRSGSALYCGSGLTYLTLQMKRPLTSPGQVFTLPDSRVSLSLDPFQSARSCRAWTGTVTWNSEVPSWSVTFNATCSEAGKSDIRLTGTWSGDV
ncbi:hypothetical protein [Myxococcus sp. RHSTA-1-4]|uniref:hypothetical protein n=1 Tax=Myxococcus sp. RHSTA-1-4 TaxID=2874601 RepID=UPI001CBEB730|nr:hypothetical protein [Myxococcus sp. RHSTA-1-4]